MWVSLECKPSPNGKPLIKASKKNVGGFLDGIRRTVKAAHGVSAAELIDQTQLEDSREPPRLPCNPN
jgi:hypothetical protein